MRFLRLLRLVGLVGRLWRNQAEIKVFYAEKKAPSFISQRVNPLNIRTNLDPDMDSDSDVDSDLPSDPDMHSDSDVDTDSYCSCCSNCDNCSECLFNMECRHSPEVCRKILNWNHELEHPYVD